MSVVAQPTPEASAPLPEMTFEEYLAWLDEDTRAEWVDGEVLVEMPAGRWHQAVVGFLLAILQHRIEARGAGGVVLAAPFVMRLAPPPVGGVTRRGSGREPDLLYLAPENERRLQGTFVDGAADIVIEIVSPDSRRRDRNDKFFEYQNAGVREYWVYEPETDAAEFYRRDETGTFRRIPLDNGTLYRSAVLEGFTLDVTWLGQRPLPSLMTVLRTWGLIPT